MKKYYLTLMMVVSLHLFILGQGNFVLNKKQDKIPFQLINNLIIFPVEVNGVELSFLLDTGVSKPIIFNFLNLDEELKINQTEVIHLRGLGEGEPIEALRSEGNIFKIGEAINLNQALYAVFDPNLNFSPQLGVPVHGIIGYDFLRDFIVEINYSGKFLKINKPSTYNYRKNRQYTEFDIEMHNNKPYMVANILKDEKKVPVKLLIDSGGSDALWLFEDKSKNISSPEKYFEDFLGHGLSGSIYGKRSKIEQFYLDDFELKSVNVAFPNSTSIDNAKHIKGRNGSISGEILKRFNIILDLGEDKVYLKKNKYYKNDFLYNKSGIALEHNGVRVIKEEKDIPKTEAYGNQLGETSSSISISTSLVYKFVLVPSFNIVELRKNSPAEKAGLKIGDIILSVNNRKAHRYSLQDIVKLFFDEDGKRIKMKVDRNGKILNFSFRLESLLK